MFQDKPSSAGSQTAGLEGLDLSAAGLDSPAIIKMLWEQFLKELMQSAGLEPVL